LSADAHPFQEPRIKPLKAPAKKTASGKKPAAKSKSAPKSTKPAARKAAKSAAPRKAVYRRAAPRKPEAEVVAKEPLPVIPAELLAPAPKAGKPRKPRGKKADAKKPAGALDAILAQLDDAKAQQVVTIALDDKSAVADAMVVASGSSSRHVGAIADQLVQKLKEKGYRDIRIEGMPQCDWVLVDAGDVVVHIFRPEVRSFYNLEKLWSAHAPDDRMAM
jgi:ribosome-associated protein